MTAKDLLVHIDKSMLADVLPVSVWNTVTTGCGKRRPSGMISSLAQEVTCPQCRAFAADYRRTVAASIGALLKIMNEPDYRRSDTSPEELAQAGREALWLEACFRGTADDPPPGPHPDLEIECCPGTWVPYPEPGQVTRCPACSSTFTASREQETAP